MHFKSQTLRSYIYENYETQIEFAAAVGVQTPQVTYWLNHGFIVIDHKLYHPVKAEYVIYQDQLYFRDDKKRDFRPKAVKVEPVVVKPKRNRVSY